MKTHSHGGSGGEGAGTARDVPALHLHHVTVRFGEAQVLNDVTLDLAEGRFLAIIGPNGAGKSTLVKVALGLVTPQSGHAAIYGRDAGHDPTRIGYVPQLKTFDRSFPATALELVVSGLRRRWPARVRRAEHDRACAALARVGAERLTDRPLARLSGGELQRAYLARALVREPELVVLDEPATGVDFLAEHDLHELLDGYQEDRGATIVMITHDLAAARHHASDVLVLNREVYGFGPPAEVLTGPHLERAYGHAGHEHGPVLP